MVAALERPLIPRPADSSAKPYSIIDWFRVHRRRPEATFVSPRALRFWVHQSEMALGYASIWADGRLLRVIPLETLPRTSDAEWSAARIALSDAELAIAGAAACNPGKVSFSLGQPAHYLGSCRVPLQADVEAKEVDLLREVASARDWNLSHVFVDSAAILVAGWAVSKDPQWTPEVLVNDRVATVEKIQSAVTRDRYWFLPGSEWFGFQATLDLAEPGDWLKIEVVGGSDEPRFARWQRLGPHDALGAIPSTENIHRVSGRGATRNSYVNTGYTEFQTIRSVFAKYGVSLDDAHTRVLDWGCGCGRITRHALALPAGAERVFGIDIDADNVAWCRDNLGETNFSAVDLQPPTSFAADTFDAVFAVSVLSHLREADAHAWLAEVARILRPGGLAVLTYNGLATASIFLSKTPAQVETLATTGFLDYRRSESLDGFIGDREYYRLVFFSDAHAADTFRQHLDLVAVESCCLAGGQNAAVLRKPGGPTN